ncbi:MAG: PHP domain-containing protein [Deltaproteobacteria bacterium]|nr:MAG: PHP domain-containing protein [Deltaproteobacteria bacterium]
MNHTHRIQFEKPKLSDLNKEFTVVDLHFHSRYSDGSNTVKQIAHRAHELGIGVAITDHNEIKGAVELDSYSDILSIPGIEITSKEGTHILIYFYDINSLRQFYTNDVKPWMGSGVMSSTALKMEDVIQLARKYETIIIFPHPDCAAYTGICNFFFPTKRLNRLFDLVDGVEVINSSNLKKWNLRCALLGFNLDKAITGGSDGHTVKYMGRAVTFAECQSDRRAFLDALKNKQNRVIGKEIDILKKVASNGFKLKTNLKNYPDLVEKNLKYGYTVINSKSKIFRDRVKRKVNGKIIKTLKTNNDQS